MDEMITINSTNAGVSMTGEVREADLLRTPIQSVQMRSLEKLDRLKEESAAASHSLNKHTFKG